MTQFRVQVRALGQRLRNFLAIDFAEAFSQPMHGHASCAFVHGELFGHGRIVNRPPVSQQAGLERVIIAWLARRR